MIVPKAHIQAILAWPAIPLMMRQTAYKADMFRSTVSVTQEIMRAKMKLVPMLTNVSSNLRT
jgi:hypothetical protein